MKKYNEVIKIEVPVNDIATKLLSTFPEDYKHRELLTETIIGTSLNSDKISYIYNALNGYTSEIDFKVGDKVLCTHEDRKVVIWKDVPNPKYAESDTVGIQSIEPKTIRKQDTTKRVAIGECEVVEIDLYRPDKLKVKYLQDNYYAKEGSQEETESWINHRTCAKIASIEYPQVSE